LSFSALVVVGDSRGHAGFGMGKAREVPWPSKRASSRQEKFDQAQHEGHYHPSPGYRWYGSAQVLLKPASEGTGVIAGGRCAR